MELNEYQRQAMTTCMESSDNFSYMMLNLVGEVGEFASKVAKGIRKRNIITNKEHLFWEDNQECWETIDSLRKEAGDILWQLAGLCHVMGWDLEDVARENLEKLSARKKAGTIDGNGDGVTKEERS